MKVNRTESCIVYSCSLFHLRGIMSISGKDSIAFYKGHFWAPPVQPNERQEGALAPLPASPFNIIFPSTEIQFPCKLCCFTCWGGVTPQRPLEITSSYSHAPGELSLMMEFTYSCKGEI